MALLVVVSEKVRDKNWNLGFEFGRSCLSQRMPSYGESKRESSPFFNPFTPPSPKIRDEDSTLRPY